MNRLTVFFQGENPTTLQLILTWGAGLIAFAVVWQLTQGGLSGLIIALLAADWTGGVVAHSHQTVADWWRERLTLRLAFYLIHVPEVVLLFLLTGSNALFWSMLAVLAAKLAVFAYMKG